MNITPTVKQLLIINILFYIGSQIVGEQSYTLFSLYYFQNPNFQFWQPLTHMFMHAELPNFSHILFNMFALYSFGSALEQFWGGKKFLFFYISCGLGAAFFHTLVNYFQIHYIIDSLSSLNLSSDEISTLLKADYRSHFDSDNKMIASNVKTILEKSKFNQEQFDTLLKAVNSFQVPAVGASGAIYGLLVAFAFMFPSAELALIFLPIPIKAKYFVPGILIMDLFLGVSGKSIFGGASGIAHFAHLGGALIGFLMMWYWKKNQFSKNRWN